MGRKTRERTETEDLLSEKETEGRAVTTMNAPTIDRMPRPDIRKPDAIHEEMQRLNEELKAGWAEERKLRVQAAKLENALCQLGVTIEVLGEKTREDLRFWEKLAEAYKDQAHTHQLAAAVESATSRVMARLYVVMAKQAQCIADLKVWDEYAESVAYGFNAALTTGAKINCTNCDLLLLMNDDVYDGECPRCNTSFERERPAVN